MTGKTLVKRLGLSEADFASIRDAVVDAECATSGEIALAATTESSDYSFSELLFAVILGAIAFAVLLPFNGAIAALIDGAFWHVEPWYLPAFYGIASFAVIALVFLVANIPAIDRLVVPRAFRRKAVRDRALRHFTESGVYATAEHTGILVFVSYMEREVRIIADTGISAKIDQKEWDAIAQGVARGVKAGKTADALVSAVRRCGELLAAHFPPKAENPDELPDGLVILEEGA